MILGALCFFIKHPKMFFYPFFNLKKIAYTTAKVHHQWCTLELGIVYLGARYSVPWRYCCFNRLSTWHDRNLIYCLLTGLLDFA